MDNKVIKTGNSTIIINGGNPLKDCPTDWEEAKKWQDQSNSESNGSWERPEWSFDCGFKLDYDGPVLRISSRFYPPTSHGGDTWDGNVTIYIFDKEFQKKEFDCKTLEQLKTEVEKYVLVIRRKIESHFK